MPLFMEVRRWADADNVKAMFDLATDITSKKLLREFADEALVISAVCHGVAALVDVPTSDGQLIAGREVTGFSNAEEKAIHGDEGEHAVPFLLEDALKVNTDRYVKSDEVWSPKVVSTSYGKGALITGQNPASAYEIAVEILKAIEDS